MGRWYTDEERTTRAAELEAARAKWEGRTLSYEGGWSRTVVDVEIDERGRVILYARGEGDDASHVELASEWEDA